MHLGIGQVHSGIDSPLHIRFLAYLLGAMGKVSR